MSLSTQGSVIKNSFLDKLQPTGSSNTFGITKPSTTSFRPTPTGTTGMNSTNASMAPKVQTGLVSNTSSSNTHTTTTNSSGATTTKPTPNKSVLAQQQMLNKDYGAGLVEDGLAGPKTSAAITQYLSKNGQGGLVGSGISTDTEGELKTQQHITKPTTHTQTITPPLTVSGQIPGLLNSGGQTSNESETQRRLIELSQAPSQAYIDAQKAYQEAIQRKQEFLQSASQMKQDINSDPVSATVMQGRNQAVQQANAEKLAQFENAITQAEQAMSYANTQQGLQTQAGQSAYSGAQTQASRATGVAGTTLGAVAPQFPGYNTPIYQPGLGAFQNNGGASGNPQTDIQNLAQQLISGSSGMGYDQAFQQLTSAYGGVIANQLLPAIQKLKPNFNVNESNAIASAQSANIGKSGQIGALADKATQGLTSLQEAYNALPVAFKTGGNLVGDTLGKLAEATGIGKTQVDNFNRVLSEVRASVQGVLSTAVELGVVRGGTTVDSLLPRNMSPEGLKTAISTIGTLMQQTKEALSKASNANVSGGGGGTSGNSGGVTFGWNGQ